MVTVEPTFNPPINNPEALLDARIWEVACQLAAYSGFVDLATAPEWFDGTRPQDVFTDQAQEIITTYLFGSGA